MLKPVNLRQHLLQQIDHYLNNINPRPKTIWESVCLFISGQGALGRQRALTYKSMIESFQNEAQFCVKVYQDIASRSDKSDLGSSKALRRCLLDGLVKSFNGKQQVELRARSITQKRASFGFFDMAAILPYEYVEQSQALAFIREQLTKLKWLTPRDASVSLSVK